MWINIYLNMVEVVEIQSSSYKGDIMECKGELEFCAEQPFCSGLITKQVIFSLKNYSGYKGDV